MKVCHITDLFPPRWGGTEVHNYTLCKYLVERGYEVDVIVIRTDDMKNKCDRHEDLEGIYVHNVFSRRLRWIFDLRKEIKEIERRGKIDVFDVHNHLLILPMISIPRDKILFSVHDYTLCCPRLDTALPCVIYSHSQCLKCNLTLPRISLFDYIHSKFVRSLTIKKSSKFMVKYNYLKELMIRGHIDAQRIEVVPHWIDEKRISYECGGGLSSKEKLELGLEGSPIVVFYGRLEPFKLNPVTLIKAFATFATKCDSKLLLIGGGRFASALKELCVHFKVEDRVVFSGHLSHALALRYMRTGDVVIFTSPYDNYGWGLLEAMAAERPIVATDVGGTSEILLDGYNALSCQPTAESIGSKIEILLEDQKLARKLAANALQTVRERHSVINLARYEQLISSLNPSPKC